MNLDVRVLVVEDEQQQLENICRRISEHTYSDGYTLKVEGVSDFSEGSARVGRGEFDIVVLDVNQDGVDVGHSESQAGIIVYRTITRARFVPVVFWTGYTHKVEELEHEPFVAVVDKPDSSDVPLKIDDILTSGIVDDLRHLDVSLRTEIAKHMWDEVVPNWSEYCHGQEGDSGIGFVEALLLSRLSRFIDSKRMDVLYSKHPGHRYIFPSVSANFGPGDILFDYKEWRWWVVLNPACDLVPRAPKDAPHSESQPKVGLVLCASAKPLREFREYSSWQSGKSNGKKKELEKFLTRTEGRYRYCPSFRLIPHLVVDLADTRVVNWNSLFDPKDIASSDLDRLVQDQVIPEDIDRSKEFVRIASLASPFAEALVVQHSQYFGRVGVPDFDCASVINSLDDSVDAGFPVKGSN